MSTLLCERHHAARKEHCCNAYQFAIDAAPYLDLTKQEKAFIKRAKDDKGHILKGESYVRQCMVDSGRAYTFKARITTHAICLKYGLYDD